MGDGAQERILIQATGRAQYGVPRGVSANGDQLEDVAVAGREALEPVEDQLSNAARDQRCVCRHRPAIGTDQAAGVDQAADHGLNEERRPTGPGIEHVKQFLGRVATQQRMGHLAHGLHRQPPQHDFFAHPIPFERPHQQAQARECIGLTGPIGGNHQDRQVRQASAEIEQQLDRGWIGPLEIIQQDGGGRLACQPLEEAGHVLEESGLLERRVTDRRRGGHPEAAEE